MEKLNTFSITSFKRIFVRKNCRGQFLLNNSLGGVDMGFPLIGVQALTKSKRNFTFFQI
jgi:hypothetical protein